MPNIKSLATLLLLLIAHTNGAFAQQTGDEIYDRAEVFPQFVGGVDSMNAYIRTHLIYPQSAVDSNIEGKVWIRFIVRKDGRVYAPEILKSTHQLFNAAALRVIDDMPVWIPASNGGQKVNSKATMPVEFRLIRESEDQSYPTFKFGDLRAFIRQKMTYPPSLLKENVGGVSVINFTVDEKGLVTRPKIAQSSERAFDLEAMRLIKLTEWEPAVINTKPVKYKMSIPIIFSPAMSRSLIHVLIEDSTVTKSPSYPGGMDFYHYYLLANRRQNIAGSSSVDYGAVTFRFKVSKEGSISEVAIKESFSKDFNGEALRLVQQMPRWEPAIKNNAPVDCYVQLPVVFAKEIDHGERTTSVGEMQQRDNELRRYERHFNSIIQAGSSVITVHH